MVDHKVGRNLLSFSEAEGGGPCCRPGRSLSWASFWHLSCAVSQVKDVAECSWVDFSSIRGGDTRNPTATPRACQFGCI